MVELQRTLSSYGKSEHNTFPTISSLCSSLAIVPRMRISSRVNSLNVMLRAITNLRSNNAELDKKPVGQKP